MAENRASQYTEGTPCWVDAQLPDVEAGKRFYGELFGWTFEDQPTGTVRALKDGDPVASLAHKTDGRLPTVWTVSFCTPDADRLCARIRAAGGQVVAPPRRSATSAAPRSSPTPRARCSRCGSPRPRPASDAATSRAPSPGSSSTHGTRRRPTPSTATSSTTPCSARGRARLRARVRHRGLRPEMPPHLLVHFAVTELEPALEEVTRLGGRVQVPPFGTSYGTVAVVTDNQGRPSRCCAADRTLGAPPRSVSRAPSDRPFESYVNLDTRFVCRFAPGGSDRKNRGACRHGGAVVRRCTTVAHRWWRDAYGEVAGKWWIS